MSPRKSAAEIGAQLRAILQRRGMTAAELARRLGIPWMHVENYLAGRYTIRRGTIERIARALECDRSELDPDLRPRPARRSENR
jgi:transcriptional regulator with XRE-family HTH domain